MRTTKQSLIARNCVVENWLREQVAPAYDALKADPKRAVSVDSVRSRLVQEFNAATSLKTVK